MQQGSGSLARLGDIQGMGVVDNPHKFLAIEATWTSQDLERATRSDLLFLRDYWGQGRYEGLTFYAKALLMRRPPSEANRSMLLSYLRTVGVDEEVIEVPKSEVVRAEGLLESHYGFCVLSELIRSLVIWKNGEYQVYVWDPALLIGSVEWIENARMLAGIMNSSAREASGTATLSREQLAKLDVLNHNDRIDRVLRSKTLAKYHRFVRWCARSFPLVYARLVRRHQVLSLAEQGAECKCMSQMTYERATVWDPLTQSASPMMASWVPYKVGLQEFAVSLVGVCQAWHHETKVSQGEAPYLQLICASSVARLAIKVAIRAAQLQGRLIDRCVWDVIPGKKTMVMNVEYVALMGPSVLNRYPSGMRNLPYGNYYYGPIRSFQIGLGMSPCLPYIGVCGGPRKLDLADNAYVDNLTLHECVSRWVFQPLHTWVLGSVPLDLRETLKGFVNQSFVPEADRRQVIALLEPVSILLSPVVEVSARSGRLKPSNAEGYGGAIDVSNRDRMKIMDRKRKGGGRGYEIVETVKPCRTKQIYVVIDIDDLPPVLYNTVAEERGIVLRVGSPDPSLCVKEFCIPMANRWYPVSSPHYRANPYGKHLVVKIERGAIPVPSVNSKTAYVVYVMLLGVGTEYYVGSFTTTSHRQESRAVVADPPPVLVVRKEDSDTEDVGYESQGGEDVEPEFHNDSMCISDPFDVGIGMLRTPMRKADESVSEREMLGTAL